MEFLKQVEKTLNLSTYRTYKKRCDSYLFKAFGHIPIKDLIPITIRQWILSLTIAPKNIRNILIPLRAVLEEAVNDDILNSLKKI